MAWQDRFRALGEELIAGEITPAEYRERSEEVLAEAEQEPDREDAEATVPRKVPIPSSAAREAPSGEMTLIVSDPEETAPVSHRISEKLETD